MSRASSNQTSGGHAPSPSDLPDETTIVAIAAALLLHHQAAAGPHGAISYCTPRPNPQPYLFWVDEEED